jgi:hypothetical protein
LAGGLSNLTYRIDGAARPLVLRRPPLGHVLSTAHDMQREFTIISALAGTAVPVPPVLAYLDDADGAAEAIAAERPDVIFSSATMQSWRIITQLPADVFRALDAAEFGPWLPMHLAPALKLMRAVAAAGSDARVVNAAFPDAVGPVLATAGFAPHVGIGNVANVVPALRGAIGLLFDAPISAVRVSLFTQHYLSHRVPAAGDSGGAPFHLRAWVGDRDVTGAFDPEEAFGLVKTRFQRTGGAFRQLITAASAVSILRPMLTLEAAEGHAPAPGGLPGGYAVRVEHGREPVALPDDLTL